MLLCLNRHKIMQNTYSSIWKQITSWRGDLSENDVKILLTALPESEVKREEIIPLTKHLYKLWLKKKQ